MKNSIGRELPMYIEGYGNVRPYNGINKEPITVEKTATLKSLISGSEKLLISIDEAIDLTGLKDGMTVSFHHHLRNGDKVVNLVMQAIAARGIKNIRVAASGLFPCHEPLVELMEKGVITQIVTDTFNTGPVDKAVTRGVLAKPAILQTHGGRPRAIESGDLHIDVAFIAAPTCDELGNFNGTGGPSACGYLSYAYVDARFADKVVAVTDNLVPYPACPIEISQDFTDYVVVVDSIGDPKGIVSGTTQITTDPVRLKIAKNTAHLLDLAGYVKEGMSFQTGAGSTSLAVAAEVRKLMKERDIKGSFGLGGIHGYFVEMLEEGLFRALLDVQCFDLAAVLSAGRNENHMAISASQYANPCTAGCVVNNLDIVILGATEIDLDFNVNVVTGSTGTIIGASGGHSDCAAGAKVTVIVANLTRKKICVVRDSVTTVTTPGETVDILVTEYGIAINPLREDLIGKLSNTELPILTIEELKSIGEGIVGEQALAKVSREIVAIVEYRDGTVIDVVRRPLQN